MNSSFMFFFSLHGPFLGMELKKRKENSKLQCQPVPVTFPCLPPTICSFPYWDSSEMLRMVVWVILCTGASALVGESNPACTLLSKMCICEAGSTKRGVSFCNSNKASELGSVSGRMHISLPVPISVHTFCHTVFLSYRP